MVDEPIGRDPFVRVKMSVNHASGRQAKTGWRIVRPLFGAALLEVELFTGRTHQIRVHMSHLGHPLLGDATYRGPVSVKTPDGKILEIGRQMLHSWRLEFSHPITGRAMAFEADIPSDMARVIKGLEYHAPKGQEVK
jgi:23S rRNA pseudouridine1911/1915/1917 synthase